MINKIFDYFSNIFKAVDKSAYNCEVFLHKESGELFIINKEGKLEGDKSIIPSSDIKTLSMPNDTTVVMTLDRLKFECLGVL